MKAVTFRADPLVLAAARRRAANDHTTLNEVFRNWLAVYSQVDTAPQVYEDLMCQLRGKVRLGRALTRDERNQR